MIANGLLAGNDCRETVRRADWLEGFHGAVKLGR